ncbi:hypothetical protein BG003_008411 [Podila horticola]|nr:hypothetical protein BG003_008411 [Podila horticola]
MNFGQQQKSVLETYIERACDPSRYEPDLALNLEICDVIKDKQKNTQLLDNCVKNCGYPFHLQIATKEFLNELVRKFPERPLAVPTPVQSKILEMIQEWYETLCRNSRYKEDLIHIRDMHRLLGFKGYRFPRLKGDAHHSVLNPVATLKSPAELEEEDRVAQSAKLQELIRRGRPEDVLAANELVKKMTGYEQEEKPDYAEQASSELDKILQKAVLLTEMLNDVKPGEIIGRGDIFEDLLGTCKAAQPKIQKFINEGEDAENMEKLLEINDIINNVIQQYGQVKSGNLVKVSVPTLGQGQDHGQQTSSTTSAPHKETSLIDLLDFGEPDSPPSASTPKAAPATTTGNLMDDLMNLNFNDGPPPAWGAAGSISLGQSISPAGSVNSTSSGAPNYSMFSAPVATVNPISVSSGTGSFANSPSLNSATRFPTHSASSSSSGYQPQQSNTSDSAFGDFDFVSNTGAAPSGPTTVVLLNKNGLQIELDIEYESQDGTAIKVMAYFSNSLNSAMSNLTFRVAVPKSLQLKLEPQSAQVVNAFSKRTVTQAMSIKNPTQQNPVRMRYHISYVLAGRTIEEQGEFSQVPAL